jgi:hypothetical protein
MDIVSGWFLAGVSPWLLAIGMVEASQYLVFLEKGPLFPVALISLVSLGCVTLPITEFLRGL